MLQHYLNTAQHNFWSMFWLAADGPSATAVGTKPQQPARSILLSDPEPVITNPGSGARCVSYARET